MTQCESPRRRRWVFRVLAVLLSLLPFLLAEALCSWMNWGNPDDYSDPFVGFGEIRPLFVLNERGDRYEISPARQLFFRPDSFLAVKPEASRRVFCLGGSTVQGRPFRIETAFSTWLRINLQSIDHEHDWEVVNCGGVSYASYRLIPILEECLKHQPDLIIVCTGHNEFLEERSYQHFKRRPDWLRLWEERLMGLRLLNLARAGVESVQREGQSSAAEARTILKTEVDALLDYKGGLAAYHWDPVWRDAVVAHYEQNLRRMIRICRQAGTPLILIRPPSNLSDCPPFKCEHRADLTPAELTRWEQLMLEARTAAIDRPTAAVGLYQQAIEIDPQYSLAHYELGHVYLAAHDVERARQQFLAARDTDICPLRILSSMETTLDQVAARYDVPLLDAHQLLEQQTPTGILGDFLLIDHIHPSVRGHQVIADALVPLVAATGLVHPRNDWHSAARTAQQAHFDSLDELYFLRGLRTREALRAWTEGRADGPELDRSRRMNGDD